MSISRSRRVVSKIWLPAVAIVILLVAGLAIKFAHGVFGSQDRTHSPGGNFAVVQFNPKNIVYEVYGDYGGWARVSYWDTDNRPVDIELTGLPWTHTETTVLTTATGDITAQVAGRNVGCRITVDGLVRSEHTATGEHAGVWCQVLSA